MPDRAGDEGQVLDGWSRAGTLAGWSRDAGALRARFQGGIDLVVAPVADGVVRLRWQPGGRAAPERSWSTVALPADCVHTIDATSNPSGTATVRTGGVTVAIGERGRIRATGPSGAVLVDDELQHGGGVRWRPGGAVRWDVRMPGEHNLYGCGQRTGLLDRRGRRYSCWTTDRFEGLAASTDEMYVAIPWLVSLDRAGRCSGVFVHSAWRSAIDLTGVAAERCTLETEAPELDVFLIDGPDPAAVIEHFTALTGRPLLPPRWALGYIQSRWSYSPDTRVREVVGEFRARRIPLDVLVIDIDHMDGHRVFTWDTERFPRPDELTADLDELGVRVAVVADCAVKVDEPGRNPVYDEGTPVATSSAARTGRS